jgi:hypothetical protein
MLHSINFWESIGVIPSPDHIEPFSSLGMAFFEVTLVVGWSLIVGYLTWKLMSSVDSPSQPIVKTLVEIFQSWTALSVFEGAVIVIDEVFSFAVKNTRDSFTIDIPVILNVSWINLGIVCLFYTFIGFQSLRKNLRIGNFLGRVAYDVGQVITMLVEGIFFLIPFGMLDFITTPENFMPTLFTLSQLSYFMLLGIFCIEYVWWTERRIEREKIQSQQESNNQIVLLQTSLIFLPLLIIITLVPSPFYFPLQNPGSWFILLTITIVMSLVIVVFYHLVKIMTPELYEKVEHRFESFKFHIDSILASRGTMFNYPEPIDIYADHKLSERVEHRWQKVTLKMACGHCYHVFKSETFRDGAKVRPIPCPFCESIATTPVWE